ncbi:hypothetical protein SLS62_002498 [Diatrype stigma]|uniref:mannan endo-1,6-alpha-mannosidase n=1 Tax=Diatrype stigma TaxID=117547 RepID=A0AAN9V6R5_9PEZI
MVQLQTIRLAQLLLLGANGALGALTVDVEDQDSIKAAASLVAEDLMTFYKGDEKGEVPGILPAPPDGDYYWWSGAALWSTLIDYRNRSGNTAYDDTITRGILWQTGAGDDFMPANWTTTMGNDDQAFWGLSASLAATTGFKDPDATDPQWVSLAKAVFDEQTSEDRRVDDGDCSGALRWQIYPFNQGYNYISCE